MSTGDAADAVLNAEGAQYLLYRNQGIAWDGANPQPQRLWAAPPVRGGSAPPTRSMPDTS